MPTLSLAPSVLVELGVDEALLRESPLTAEAITRLEGLLVSRQFDLTRPIGVIVTPTGGFLLTQ
jgi:hypothetical protein